jgi:hypothetical protein
MNRGRNGTRLKTYSTSIEAGEFRRGDIRAQLIDDFRASPSGSPDVEHVCRCYFLPITVPSSSKTFSTIKVGERSSGLSLVNYDANLSTCCSSSTEQPGTAEDRRNPLQKMTSQVCLDLVFDSAPGVNDEAVYLTLPRLTPSVNSTCCTRILRLCGR